MLFYNNYPWLYLLLVPDYDYDDVYGKSLEEDVAVSPSTAGMTCIIFTFLLASSNLHNYILCLS